MKKKSLIALTLCSFMIVGGAIALSRATGLGTLAFNPVFADEYTITVDATGDNSCMDVATRNTLLTSSGNEVTVDYDGVAPVAEGTGWASIQDGGYIETVGENTISGVTSLNVTFTGDLRVSFGFEDGVYVRTNQQLTSGTAYTFGGQKPNYVRMTAKNGEVVIDNFVINYTCSKSSTPDLYTNLTDWYVTGLDDDWDLTAVNSKRKLEMNTGYPVLDKIEYTVTLDLEKGDTFKIIKDVGNGANWDGAFDSKNTNWKLEGGDNNGIQAGHIIVQGDGDVECVVSGTYSIYWTDLDNKWDSVNKEGGNYITTAATKAPEQLVDIYFDNSDFGWDTPHAYYWIGSGDLVSEIASYPGVPMTETEHANIWSIKVDIANYYYIIFNNGASENSEKASETDLVIPTTDNNCFSDGGWTTVTIAVHGVDESTYDLWLKPNSNWVQRSAWFAAYFFGDSGNTWLKMTDIDGDGVYGCQKPAGYPNVIFCRICRQSVCRY